MKHEPTDFTGRMCPLGNIPPYTKEEMAIPMYSYERPAYIVWQAIAEELEKAGWTEQEIIMYLQSKYPRWQLDGNLGDLLEKLGKDFGAGLAKDPQIRKEISRWVEDSRAEKA